MTTKDMKAKKWLLLALGLVLLAGGVGVQAASTAAAKSTPRIFADLAYGPDPAQKMDVYLPTGFAGPRPGIELIHGGGWQGGDKGFYTALCRMLAARGFVAFSVNYRLAPTFRYPAQADDVQSAARWMRAHAAVYHFDPTRLGALGDSSGAHLALILGTRDTQTNVQSSADPALAAQSSRAQCVVDFYGPSNLTATALTAAQLAGPETDGQKIVFHLLHDLLGGTPQETSALARAASPLFSVDAKSAPTLIVTGMDDPLVLPSQSERLADALHAAGVETTLAIIYKQGHGFLNPNDPQIYDAMAIEWLTRHLKPQ
jgi:acetyl esterase/lipase